MAENASKLVGEKNRKLFLQALEDQGTVQGACNIVGVTRSAYEKWRQRFPEFAAKADALRNELLIKGKNRVKNFSWKKCAKETLNVYNKL